MSPIRLSRRTQPFDSNDFIYELKIDGWRALAFIENGHCKLVSRNGNELRRFQELGSALATAVKGSAILDGEICCLDPFGRSVFNDLMFRRGECFFYAFDVLRIGVEELRDLPLLERKSRLKAIIPPQSQLLYVDHVDSRGCDLFERACTLDLEGIVAKRKSSKYMATEKPSRDWIKIKNPRYSQAEGRHEMFERFAGREVTTVGKQALTLEVPTGRNRG